MIHRLKTWPALFEAIKTGRKTFDLRENDRNFREGDILNFREWEPRTELYTGREINKKIGFMIQGEWGLKTRSCAMSLLDCSGAATPEPPPTPGKTDIWPLVLDDIQARVEAGRLKYNTVLQSHNGRDALIDAYQEAIDLTLYLRQLIEERKNDA